MKATRALVAMQAGGDMGSRLACPFMRTAQTTALQWARAQGCSARAPAMNRLAGQGACCAGTGWRRGRHSGHQYLIHAVSVHVHDLELIITQVDDIRAARHPA